MKSLNLLLIGFILFLAIGSFAQVGINEDNSNPDPSAMLDVKTTNKGVLVPRLTSTQREAIASPANGLLVWDSDTESFWFFNQIKWIELIDRGNSPWSTNTNNDIYTISSKVGIGTINPSRQLHSYSNNSNLNTSPFLIEQAGAGDAFFNIGLTGSHFYNLGVDQSDGGKFKIGYNSSQPYGVALNTRFTLTTSGQVGIGTSSPSDRMQVDADAAEPAFRVRQGGATKLRVHTNGGLSVGVNSTPPVDGLLVTGAIEPWGNIITDQNLNIESTGTGTFVQLQKNLSSFMIDETGIYGNVQDNLILETNMENNKVEMNGNGLTASSDNNIAVQSSSGDITIESLQNNSIITIKAGSKEIIIDDNGGITINSDGENLTINTNGGDFSVDAGTGSINLSGENIDFLADNFLNAISQDKMVLKSDFDELELRSSQNMTIYSGNILSQSSGAGLTLTSGQTLKLDAGLILDLDGMSQMTLNAPLIKLNNGALGAARKTDITVGNASSQQIISGSNSVLIGN